MRIAIELDLDESWNPSEGELFKPAEIVKYAITPAEGVIFKVIYSKDKDDREFDVIEKLVCSYTGISPDEIQHKTRKREVVEARQICHYISRKKGLGTFSSIGWRFGRRDHASAMNSNTTVTTLLKCDKQFKNQYETFINSFFEDGK